MKPISIFIYLYTVFVFLPFIHGKTNQPNILWITSEDNSIEWVGCYGSKNAKTPNIDQLAKEGFRYLYCFDNGAVCAPTRSSWITGMHSISNGTQPMRSGFEIPESIKFYNELLQEAGYFTSNCSKTDYNLRGPNGRNPKSFWNYSGKEYAETWKKRKKDQPFFTVYNIGESHESRAFGDHNDESIDPQKMILAPYHPDLPEMRNTYAKYASAISKMDALVGQAIENLKNDNLYEDTIIVYNSDHGGVLARSKRFLFQNSLHCPLIIRIPENYKTLWPAPTPGQKIDRLVSFIDMPKTWLSLTGAHIPQQMQGRIFLGHQTEPEPTHHFAFRGRADERIENARAICNKHYLYIRNYMPQLPWMQHLEYLWRIPAMQAWQAAINTGTANELQRRFLEPKTFTEELYDMQNDPHNLHNLAHDPAHQIPLQKLRHALREQQLTHHDSGLMPESEIARLPHPHIPPILDHIRTPPPTPRPRPEPQAPPTHAPTPRTKTIQIQ